MPKKPQSSPKPSLPSVEDNNQKRKVGMFKQSSDFDRFDKENPFTKMASNPCGKGYKK